MSDRARRLALALALLGALAGCNRVAVERKAAPADATSVLLVTIDTLRADHVGAYGQGSAATPHLDRLAAEGALFETVISPAPLTLPSHATILTGMLPPRHGVRHNGVFVLSPSIERLPQRFAEAGYATGAFVGAMVLGPEFGLTAGFDRYDADIPAHRAAATGFYERPGAAVTAAARAWLAEQRGPFFLWVHYFDAHASHHAPPGYGDRFPGDAYSAEIAYVDDQVAALLGDLAADGRLPNTLVAVTADHGESLGEHGEVSHSYTLYDATQRVPWILSGPGVRPGTRVGGVTSLADVAPTLLGLVGLPALPEANGASRVAALAGDRSNEGADAYSESLATEIDHGWSPLHAVRSPRRLFVRAPRPELYDVAADPGEVRNLLPGDEAEAAPLDARLSAYLAEAPPDAKHALDAETRAQLQALGYALPDEPVAKTGLDPKDGLAFIVPYEYARVQLARGRPEEAVRVGEGLLSHMDGSLELHNMLALSYLALGRIHDAARHAARCVELAPGSARHQMVLAITLVRSGRVSEGAALFEKAARMDPHLAEAQVGLMWRAKLGGSLDDAEAAAGRAVALDPTNADIRLMIGDLWDELGQYDRALARYREAVEMDPENALAHLGVAVNLIRLGDLSEAEAHLHAAGEAGRSLGARMRVAIALAGRGRYASAERVLRSVLAERPDFEAARAVLARVQEREGAEGHGAGDASGAARAPAGGPAPAGAAPQRAVQ